MLNEEALKFSFKTYLVWVDWKRGHGVDCNDGGSRVGVNEVVSEPLAQRVKDRRLVEEPQLGQVLHGVEVRGIRLLDVVLVNLDYV
jgi:hypothetical protein